MARAEGEASLGQLPPGVESVVLSARHNDGFGFLGREGFKVLIRMVFEFPEIENAQLGPQLGL